MSAPFGVLYGLCYEPACWLPVIASFVSTSMVLSFIFAFFFLDVDALSEGLTTLFWSERRRSVRARGGDIGCLSISPVERSQRGGWRSKTANMLESFTSTCVGDAVILQGKLEIYPWKPHTTRFRNLHEPLHGGVALFFMLMELR